MSKLKTYQASRVTASIFGITIKGFVADNFLSIERQSPATSTRKAIDGSGTAFIDQHGTFKVTLRLDQISESNSVLDLIYRVYMKSGSNLRMPLIITDGNSGTTFTSMDTLFDGDPPTSFGATPQQYEWVFQCESPTNSISGYVEDDILITSLQRVIDFVDMAETLGVDTTAISDKITSSVSSLTNRVSSLL